MLGHDVFYFNLIRKYIGLFGTMFNEIFINRTDSNDVVVKYIKIPISYSPKDKMLARVDGDPNISRPTAAFSPRMSYEMTTMYYDSSRHLPAIGKNVIIDTSNDNKMKRQYNPVPWNFDFNLYIYSKNAEDATKIIEQILPFFTPAHTPTVELVAEMNEVRDIPIVLNSATAEDNYADPIEQRRQIIYTLQFTMKGWLFGPVVSTGIIKFANTTFYVPTTQEIRDSVGLIPGVERVTIRPGLTANGEPTSNLSLTIALNDIDANDNYGYIITSTTLVGNNV